MQEPFGQRPEGLVGDAAQAEPRRRRADLRARARRARRTRSSASRTSRSGTSATSRTRRPSASSSPTRSSRSTTCSTASPGSSRASSCASERMRRNLEASHYLFFSQRVLLALVESGLARDDAYRLVQRNAMRAWDEELDFRELVPRRRRDRVARRPRRRLRPRRVHAPRRHRLRPSPHHSPPRRNPFMPEATHVASGKVREIYALDDDRLLLVASDRISTFDVVLPTEIPDKGRVLTGLSGFWFTLLRADRPEPHARDPRRRPLDGVPAARDAADRVRRARLPRRLGLEGLPGDRRRLRAHAARGAARVGQAARADLHAGDEGADGPRREHHARAGRRARRRGAARARSSASRSRSTRRPRTTRCARGIIIADTKFELGLDADGNLVLGDEALTPDSSRFWPGRHVRARPRRRTASTSSSCATTARRPAGTRPIPARSCPDDVVADTRAKYVEAFERLTTIPFPAYLETRRWCSGEGDRPRPAEAGDPRPAGRGGRDRRSGISASRSRDARVGKVVDLEVDAADAAEARAQVEKMCEQLLANPLIESYEVEIHG